MAIVYLLHFERRISDKHTTQHYIGYTTSLKKRVQEHRDGTSGVRLLQVAKERGIGFEVIRTWSDGTRKLERSLKNGRHGSRLCPICKARVSV